MFHPEASSLTGMMFLDREFSGFSGEVYAAERRRDGVTMEKTADVVIIGGGVIGVSIAYHLALKKAGKIILLEKGQLGEGSTSRCVGGIRIQFSTEINIRFLTRSTKDLRALQRGVRSRSRIQENRLSLSGDDVGEMGGLRRE